MRLIDADTLEYSSLIVSCGNGKYNTVKVLYECNIENAPTIDIVRCRDCRHWDANDSMGEFCWCDFSEDRRAPEDFCSYGEVKHETD